MALPDYYRHRRAATANSTLPTTVEPGELVLDTFRKQIYAGDQATGSIGIPRALLAVTYHTSLVAYHTADLVARNGIIYQCRTDIPAKGFNAADWYQVSGAVINQGVFIPTPVRTNNTTAASTDWVRVDTRSNTVSVTLPLSPADGTSVRISDVANNFDHNHCTVRGNGQLLNGSSSPIVLDEPITVTAIFTTGLGWSVS
jgi:hypothetical protein